MRISRTVAALVAGLTVLAIAGCHTVGHVPPGQAKKVIAPPPGHVGDKPGRGN